MKFQSAIGNGLANFSAVLHPAFSEGDQGTLEHFPPALTHDIHALRMQWKRGRIVMDGKRHGVSVWRLPPTETLL